MYSHTFKGIKFIFVNSVNGMACNKVFRALIATDID